MKQKLPIGIQSFSKIINKENNFLYVDKTREVLNLLKNGSSYNFFARPRRFGKSLLLDTIRYLYSGDKDLFKGLYAENNWDFDNKKHPVIKIVFGKGTIYDAEGLKSQLRDLLKNISEEHNVYLKSETVSGKFDELIIKLKQKYNKNVVILIDEYDKPILDKIHDLEKSIEIREELKGFYSVIKGADEFIEFVFITGVSKFSKVSLFSGLNNLEDLTINKNIGELVGFTLKEIKRDFKYYLEGVDINKMQKWYNGFNFLSKHKVFNPFDILLFLKSKEYKNYWFETATPMFLINLLKKSDNPVINFEGVSVGEEILGSFDIEKINILTLMFQTGYLTIKSVRNGIMGTSYNLGIPNKEIQKSLNEYLMKDYFGFENLNENNKRKDLLEKSILEKNPEYLVEAIKSLFAGIPYSNYTKNDISKYEGFYSSVLYSFLAGSGIDFVSEDHTNYGRVDFTINYGGIYFIIELKVEKTGKSAIDQIKEKKYYEKYLENADDIFLIGLNFNEQDRNLDEYVIEKI